MKKEVHRVIRQALVKREAHQALLDLKQLVDGATQTPNLKSHRCGAPNLASVA